MPYSEAYARVFAPENNISHTQRDNWRKKADAWHR